VNKSFHGIGRHKPYIFHFENMIMKGDFSNAGSYRRQIPSYTQIKVLRIIIKKKYAIQFTIYYLHFHAFGCSNNLEE
jgi:hypothetical protein